MSIEPGQAALDSEVRDLTTAMSPVTGRSADAAVSAFAAMATWLLASPAAKNEPSLAVEEVGATRLDPSTSETLTNMQRTPGDNFQPELGGYRILAYAGNEKAPDQVMVEVVGPLTTGASTRWVVIGGVVAWSGSEWKLFSMAPRELSKQPSGMTALSSRQGDLSWLEGLGWRSFAPSASAE